MSLSVEENRAVCHRFFEEVLNKKDMVVLDEIVHPDFIDNNPYAPAIKSKFAKPSLGKEGLKQYLSSANSAFLDWHFTVEDTIAEGDKVVLRFAAGGAHQGEFLGIPKTGKRVKITGVYILRLADGKIVEKWVNPDLLLMMQQLGAFPC